MAEKQQSGPTIMIIAGEASGDVHGAALIQSLKTMLPHAQYMGMGGNLMKQEGVKLLYHIDDLAYIGFVEVIKHYGFFKRVFNNLLDIMDQKKPDILILIDYPGFNLRLAKQAKKKGIKIFYFIAPQVWAWGQKRAKKMAKFIDHLAVIFAFEKPFFEKFGIKTHFVGHPLVNALQVPEIRTDFYRRVGLNETAPLLTILPGSRKQEINHLLLPALETATQLREKHPHLQISIGLADSISTDFIQPVVDRFQNIKILRQETYGLMKYSRACIVASGTATLETGCFETPFLIVYKVSPITYFLGKYLIKIPYIGLINVVAGKKIVQEFIQSEIEPVKMIPAVEQLLFDENVRTNLTRELSTIKATLGEPGAAEKTAKLVVNTLFNENNKYI